MNKFKIGDKVVRTGPSFAKVEKGCVYTVTLVGDHFIMVDVDSNMTYGSHFFDHYKEPKFKNTSWLKPNLTLLFL